MKKQSALSALTLSALAIPNAANSAVAPENKTIGIRYSQYVEAPMSLDRVSSGDTGRYNIDILQFRFMAPLENKYSIDTNFTYETMTGASALSSTDNGNDQTEVIMSGASIEEKRVDASVLGTRYFEEGTLAGNLAISTENDYQSVALGVSGSLELFQKHTTLLASASISHDELSPTDADLFGGARAEADGQNKRSFSFYEGVTQVLNKFSTLQVGFGYTRLSGYLSDPYRMHDARPDVREQNTLSLQYRHYLTQYGGMALHLDYRYYQDDWGVMANTTSVGIWKDVEVFGMHFTLAPNARYHWQHAADFYTVDSNTDGEFYSDDYRLSAYGAILAGIDMQYHHKDTIVTVSVSQYLSAENWGLSGAQETETPALVDFTTFSLGMDYNF